MNRQFSEVVLPLVEKTNSKAFKFVTMLCVLGIIILGVTVGVMEVGTLRTISVLIAFLFIISPFLLGFFLENTKKIGVIRLTSNEILIKKTGEESFSYDINTITDFNFIIKDYEGEKKTVDMINTASMINYRSGAENIIYWNYKGKEYIFQFKLTNALFKQKAIYFLKLLEKENNKN